MYQTASLINHWFKLQTQKSMESIKETWNPLGAAAEYLLPSFFWVLSKLCNSINAKLQGLVFVAMPMTSGSNFNTLQIYLMIVKHGVWFAYPPWTKGFSLRESQMFSKVSTSRLPISLLTPSQTHFKIKRKDCECSVFMLVRHQAC